MLSLGNAFNEQDLLDLTAGFVKQSVTISHNVELKIDGLAVSLRYENGVFVRGAGLMEMGQRVRILQKPQNHSIHPAQNQTSLSIEVRGEVFMPKPSLKH
ncbi:hypothetical protein ACEQPO_04610 [Bacillus sp. SL00103]